MIKRSLFLKTCLVLLLAAFAGSQALASVTLNSTNFPDANFRTAVAQAAGVSDGATFNEANLTTLDVSNKSITNLKGLEKLTGLTYLDISNNSGLTTGANISTLTSLRTLKASNCNIRTLADTYETYSSTRYAGLIVGNGNSTLRYLDLSHNDRFFTSGNLQYLTGLETLLLNDCAHYDYWGYQPGLGMTSLKYVDVSNCPAMDRIYLRGATQLKHLNAEGTLVQGFTTSPSNTATTANYIVLSANSPVEYINIGNCAITNVGLNGITTYNVTSLDTLIVNGNNSFGNSTAFDQLPSLTYLDISNCDIYFRTGYLLNHLTPGHNPNLETLLVNNSKLGSSTEGISGFANLKLVDVSGNPSIAHFWVNGSPLIESLNISGNTGMTYLQLNNDGLPRNNFTLIGGASCTALNSLYLNGNNYATVAAATSDFASIATLQFLYLENNSGFNGGALTMTANDCGSLTGIDLGNNGFTSFHAPSLPPTLTALMLGNNTAMKRLEMHNNPGITTMTASPTMSDGSGLYLLGCSALTYMDISGTAETPNHFQRIGNNFSLQDVPIDTLKASHNKFYTFRNLTTVSTKEGWETYHKTNLVYGWKDLDTSQPNNGQPSATYYYYGIWPASPAQPDSASLEQLTKLEYLDLSYCQLKDSVHLHKNRELLYLDLSHNRKINRYYDAASRPSPKGAEYRAWPADGTIDKRSFPDYKLFLWLKSNDATGLEEFTGDYNDTIGLYDLDLVYNNKLEYLDISYTGIEQTAANHCYMPNARYVWIQDLPNLKYFYADFNGMRSLGITTKNGRIYREGLKSLERLSVIGMRGSDDRIMQGSTNYTSINPNADRPSPLVNLHYINLSYASFDSIGIYNEKVDTIIIRGNPIHYLNLQKLPLITYVDARECALKMRGYDPETGRTYRPNVNRYKNGARIGGVYYASSTNEYIPILTPEDSVNGRLTSVFSGLRAVRAYDRPELTTLLLDSCNALTEVYAHHNPKLPKIHGFEHLAYPKPTVDAQYNFPTDVDSLRLVWVNDNTVFNELNLTRNVNLQYLHAYNDKTLGNTLDNNGMHLNENVNLKSAWVSNSALRSFSNHAGNNLDTLKIWQNPHLNALDVTDNKKLKVFDLHNCMIRTLNVSECEELTFFNCCNNDSTIEGTSTPLWDDYEVYGYTVPGSVPTSINTPGQNSIAVLNFGSKDLETVIADRNDLFCITGLEGNSKLDSLSFSYNHINAIDLTGCNALKDESYDHTHNGRGFFEAEYSKWYEKNGNDVDTCHVYYLQLDPNAGDEFNPLQHDSYLGYRAGCDSIDGILDADRWRNFDQDGFDPDKVAAFTLSASGPHQGLRHAAPQRNQVVYDTQNEPDTAKMYGKVVFLDVTNNTDWPGHHYIEYEYYDGRVKNRGDKATSTFYMVWKGPGDPTDVEETMEDDLSEPTVVSERYFDISGKEYSEPVQGLNIIMRQMSDGSTQTIKVMRQ